MERVQTRQRQMPEQHSVWPWGKPREERLLGGGLAKTAGGVGNRETLSYGLTPAVSYRSLPLLCK